MILTLFIILSLVFILIRSMPGSDGLTEDPSVNNEVEDVETSVVKDYLTWVRNIFPKYTTVTCGAEDVINTTDEKCYEKEEGSTYKKLRLTYWGYSTKVAKNEPAFNVVKDRMPISMFINIIVLVIAMPAGITLGTIAALRKNKPIDHAISFGVIIFISVPSFVLAFFMTYFISFKLGWFPVHVSEDLPILIRELFKGNLLQYSKPGIFGEDRVLLDGASIYGEIPTAENTATPDQIESTIVAYGVVLKSLVLPIAALAFGPIAALTRYTRAELTETLTSDFMLLAKSKGLTRTQATLRHAFRNSMLPLLSMIIGMFIGVMGGSLMIERIFNIPGMGSASYDALTGEDYPVVVVTTAFYTTIGLATVLFVDLMYGVVDPRVRLGGRS